MGERWEWVEIIEPKTRERMYANLTTGECLWEPPPGVKVKETHENQWWELYDQNTGRNYYYNATSQKTVWHRPAHCDIIPLAKLQTMKLTTEHSPSPSTSSSKLSSNNNQNPTIHDRPRPLQKSESVGVGKTKGGQPSPSMTTRRQGSQHYSSYQMMTGTFDNVDQLINGTYSQQSAKTNNLHASPSGASQEVSAGRFQNTSAPININDGRSSLRGPSKSELYRRGSLATSTPSKQTTALGHQTTKPTKSFKEPLVSEYDRMETHLPKRSTSDHGDTNVQQMHRYQQERTIHRSESFDQTVHSDASAAVLPNDYSSLRTTNSHRLMDSNLGKGRLNPLQENSTPLSSSLPISSSIPAKPRLGVKALPRTNPSYRSPLIRHNSKDQPTPIDAGLSARRSSEDSVRKTSEAFSAISSSTVTTYKDASHTPTYERTTTQQQAYEYNSEILKQPRGNVSQAESKIPVLSDVERSTSSLQDSFSTIHESSTSSKELSPEISFDKRIDKRLEFNERPAYGNVVYSEASDYENSNKFFRQQSTESRRNQSEPSDSSSSNERMVFVQPTSHVINEANKLIVNKVDPNISNKGKVNYESSAGYMFPNRTDVFNLSKQATVKEIKSVASGDKKRSSYSHAVNDYASDSETELPKFATSGLKLSTPQKTLTSQTSKDDERFPVDDVSIALDSRGKSQTPPTEGRVEQKLTSVNNQSQKSSASNTQMSGPVVRKALLLDSNSEGGDSSHSSLASLSNVGAPCGSPEDLENSDLDVYKSGDSRQGSLNTKEAVTTNPPVYKSFVLVGDSKEKPTDSNKPYDSGIKRSSTTKENNPVVPSNGNGPTAVSFHLDEPRSAKSSASSEHDYVNLPEEPDEDDGIINVQLRKRVVQRSASTSNANKSFQYDDSTASSGDSSRVLTERHNLPTCETPPLHHSYSEMIKSRPQSMLIDGSQPSVQQSLHRQHTFAHNTQNKGTSLSRGIDLRKIQSEGLIDWYAENGLVKPKKGLFGKKQTPEMMLSWTQDPISTPMLKIEDKILKKEALETFKLIQMYMGDRKAKQISIHTALNLTTKGWSFLGLRDEIFVQMIRQVTENPREESLTRGWELLAICLAFFPPSQSFYDFLKDYIVKHLEKDSETDDVLNILPQVVPISHYAHICKRRLDRINSAGARKGLKKPTQEDIEQAKRSICHPSMFGDTLLEIMAMQKTKYPDRQLPWIQTTLSEEILRLNGAQTEGIFRVPADMDEVNLLKVRFDHWEVPSNLSDPHLLASLLKMWLRDLYEPIIPPNMYERCMLQCDNPDEAMKIVHSLPNSNRLSLSYLIRFLQVFAAPENVALTKMDINNLAMVMAPNCLRCESEDPRIIFENTRKEMQFIRTLIKHMDTNFMEGVI